MVIGINYKFKNERQRNPAGLIYGGITTYDGPNKKRRFYSGDPVQDWKAMQRYLQKNNIGHVSLSSSVDHFVMDDSGYFFAKDEDGRENLEKRTQSFVLPRGTKLHEAFGGFHPITGVQIHTRVSDSLTLKKGKTGVTLTAKFANGEKYYLDPIELDKIQPVPEHFLYVFGNGPCWVVQALSAEKAKSLLLTKLETTISERTSYWRKAAKTFTTLQ